MSLTLGRGPWSPHRAGHASEPLPQRTAYLEPWLRRVRAEVGGRQLLATDDAQALHCTGAMMAVYVPREAVDTSLLSKGDTETVDGLGELTWWHADGAEKVAWSVSPGPGVPDGMDALMGVDPAAVEHWYEEDEEPLGHPRDPYHRVDTRRSARHVVVRVDGEIVADTQRPVALFETSLPPRWYVPRDDVAVDLAPTTTHSVCPYKGVASYWSALGHDDIAFSYEVPLPESQGTLGCVCFLADGVTTTVDGVET